MSKAQTELRGWVNVYLDEDGALEWGRVRPTKKEANKDAKSWFVYAVGRGCIGTKRLKCIEVRCELGDLSGDVEELKAKSLEAWSKVVTPPPARWTA
jgi:hypothetical protein